MVAIVDGESRVLSVGGVGDGGGWSAGGDGSGGRDNEQIYKKMSRCMRLYLFGKF